MGQEKSEKTVEKRNYKKMKYCAVISIIVAFVVFVIYAFQPFYVEHAILNISDDDQVRVVDRMVTRLKEQQRRSKKQPSMWNTFTKILHVSSSSERSQEKLVLLYTGFFGERPWGWLKDTKSLNEWEGMTCPHYHCKLTYDKNDLKKSDAVIFHAEDLVSRSELNALQLARPRNQRWIFFSSESPVNLPENHVINNMFNWTMSYDTNSDIFKPYGFYYPVKKSYDNPDTLLEFLESKDMLVVWLSSHCGLLRDKYVRRLRAWIDVDVFGKCGERVGGRSGKCAKNSPDCKKHLKRYKFVLAFENSFCTDYITEKYWFSLMMGIVPVVMGGAEYNSKMAIPGSYINAMDFPTIKALADHLKHLDSNDKEYNKYFEWRKKYKVVNNAPWACQLCAALNIDSRPKVYNKLEDFWSPYKKCGIKEDVIKKAIAKQPLLPGRKFGG